MEKFTDGLNHPIDIAYSLMVCAGKYINSPIEKSVVDAIYQLQNMANDNSYPDCWRSLYLVLNTIANIPEYEPLPFN